MNEKTLNELAYDNEIGRDVSLVGSSARTLYHTLSTGVKAVAGSIALGFRIFMATAEKFGSPRM